MKYWQKAWAVLRELTGDDAYDRYLAHERARHPGRPPKSRKEFVREREARKWNGVSRCC